MFFGGGGTLFCFIHCNLFSLFLGSGKKIAFCFEVLLKISRPKISLESKPSKYNPAEKHRKDYFAVFPFNIVPVRKENPR